MKVLLDLRKGTGESGGGNVTERVPKAMMTVVVHFMLLAMFMGLRASSGIQSTMQGSVAVPLPE